MKILHLSRIWPAPCKTGIIFAAFLDSSTATITIPPYVSSWGEKRTHDLLPCSGTTLVLKGWATRSHWVRIAWRAPAHCPGPVRRYWYGVQGPKKTFTQSTGSLRSSLRKFGRTPTCDWKSIMVLVSYTKFANDNTILYLTEQNWPHQPWNPGKGCNLPGEPPVVGSSSWENKNKEWIL